MTDDSKDFFEKVGTEHKERIEFVLYRFFNDNKNYCDIRVNIMNKKHLPHDARYFRKNPNTSMEEWASPQYYEFLKKMINKSET
jgi:hypothetical protein